MPHPARCGRGRDRSGRRPADDALRLGTRCEYRRCADRERCNPHRKERRAGHQAPRNSWHGSGEPALQLREAAGEGAERIPRARMSHTLAQKLVARAAGRSTVTPGDIVTCKVDLAMVHDSSGPRRLKPRLERLGAKVWDPKK